MHKGEPSYPKTAIPFFSTSEADLACAALRAKKSSIFWAIAQSWTKLPFPLLKVAVNPSFRFDQVFNASAIA